MLKTLAEKDMISACNYLEAVPDYAADAQNYSVLFIDDDLDQRQVFEAYLTREGMDVTSTGSVKDALKLLYNHRFDVVVCDLRMPKLNGFDFVRLVRKDQRILDGAGLPIIILTASGSTLELDSLMAGADMFCEKSMAGNILASQIRFLLS